MTNLPERAPSSRKSMLSVVDDGILVVVAVVGALVVLKLIGVIVATIWFVVKAAFVAGLIYVVVRALRSRAR